VWGYIKDPPKAGSRWEKFGKNRLNRFVDRLNRFPPGRTRFTNLLSRRLDRNQNRLSREKFRLNRFSQKVCNVFSDSIDCQTGESRDGRGTVPKPVEPVLGPVELVSRAENQVELFEVNKGRSYVGSEKWFFSRHLRSGKVFSKMIWKDFELSSLQNLLNHCGSLLIERRIL
jgi:hypothetical protein